MGQIEEEGIGISLGQVTVGHSVCNIVGRIPDEAVFCPIRVNAGNITVLVSDIISVSTQAGSVSTSKGSWSIKAFRYGVQGSDSTASDRLPI